MNKKLLLGAALLLGTASFAQTMVSTTPQNKKVVLEEFTGIHCVWCPDGHVIANAMKNANPDNVFLVNIHSGGFAAPGPNQPDYRTTYGEGIRAHFGANSFPTGMVNRKPYVDPETPNAPATILLNRGDWQGAANEILQQASYVNIAASATLHASTRELEVNVEVYYTGNSPQATNKLNVALLQDNTRGPQSGGGMGNNYNHMHRLVDFLTGQWGVDINDTNQGDFTEFNFIYTVPYDYRDIDAILTDLKIVAYVAEGHQEILTGAEVTPTINRYTNDVVLVSADEIAPTCTDEVTPKIKIQNVGGNTINSLDIKYSINGGAESTYTWTGSLATDASAQITLDAINFDLVNQDHTLTINLPNDDFADNNSFDLNFKTAPESSSTIFLRIQTLASGDTTSWKILDSNGDVVESGGPYGKNRTINLKYSLDVDCYQFVFNDSTGSGTSVIMIRDVDNNIIFRENSYKNGDYINFSTNGILSNEDFDMEHISLYPNPSEDFFHINNAEGYNILVHDITGRTILNKMSISNTETIDVRTLDAGVYFVEIYNETNSTVKKLIVK